MDSLKLRQTFLDFFEKRNHTIVPSSSLLPSDPSVLLTTAGMQQFKDYYLDKPSPYGKNATSCQKCFRTSDIEEVGDETHLTFLEMLGNFSFGGYFKKEAIEMAFAYLTKDCGFKKDKLWFTVFKGERKVPKDEESLKIWQSLGVSKERISFFGREDNFWGPTGKEGPCGPTTEIHYDLTEKPCQKGKKCLPNCDCGRFIELWNLVFNEYFQDEKKRLTLLKQKGVDTGMGLERLAMVSQEKPSIYETDLFLPIISEIRKSAKSDSLNVKAERIIADHTKGAVFLISEGIFPSNTERGYILRRILRRSIRYGKFLGLPEDFLIPLAQKIIESYKSVYPEIKSKETDILTVIQKEQERFRKTLEKGLKQFEKLSGEKKKSLSGKEVFQLFDTYGFPLELTEELAMEKGLKIDKKGFEKAFKKHREVSRAGMESKFGGIGKDATYQATKLHTATHLLHQSLRDVLGEHVKQMGSDITPQRLRFDFSHSGKMTDQEIEKIQDLINQKIKEDLSVVKKEMDYEEAIGSGALAFFKEKYPQRVTVYSIGDYSKEICGGPHVEKTSELGELEITKEESSGAGVRRIRAVLK